MVQTSARLAPFVSVNSPNTLVGLSVHRNRAGTAFSLRVPSSEVKASCCGRVTPYFELVARASDRIFFRDIEIGEFDVESLGLVHAGPAMSLNHRRSASVTMSELMQLDRCWRKGHLTSRFPKTSSTSREPAPVSCSLLPPWHPRHFFFSFRIGLSFSSGRVLASRSTLFSNLT